MKKLFLLSAAIVAAISINAAVVDVDLSKAKSYTSAGSSSLVYDEASGELTVNWTVTTEWEVSGIQIPLGSLTGITSLQFEFQGDGSGTDFLHWFTDEQGSYWWDDNGWYSFPHAIQRPVV